MELSDPAAPDNSALTDATNRRKSGRTRQKPVTLYEDPNLTQVSNGRAKRKRAEPQGKEAENIEEEEPEDDESAGESESDPDEEELKERRKRAAKSRKSPNKPAAKKPKTARNTTTKLAIRPAASGVKKTPKPRKPQAPQSTVIDNGTGLYAEVFSQEDTMDDVAAGWITRYQAHQTSAMCDLVNFILKCTGCDLQVDVHDIEDPDNVASKLTDLQEEYQAQKITDYPLISKAKASASFRSSVTEFFRSLIATAHASSLLYSDEALIENIEAWVTAMSSSGNRPFRHTATVIALSISNAVCGLVTEIIESTAKTMRQKEGENKKKTVNKGRVAALQATLNDDEKRQRFAEGILRDLFDAVFVHRYRDVDPKIRVDCVTALGTWITTLPDIFFEGQYLRYLGWVLSDTSAPTRAEVIKQLSRLFKHKDNVGRLRAFTERFRPRIVEMAARDAEPSIRASSVGLLDLIRDVGLLEPDDIDTIGKLIFDTEPRVRKAVAGFFAENINDHFESTIEELGGEEGIDEALGEEDEEDFDTPRKTWLKLKCLAEVLRSCDSDNDEESPDPIEPGAPGASDSLAAMGVDSRFSLAAQAICNGLPELKEWEILAGYLLYDHSSIAQTQASDDARHTFMARCQPSERQEFLLLEVLNAAVKQRLVDAVENETEKKGKKTKARKNESREIQETTAVHLVQVIPRLLKKFGASSATASVVLRLEHVLNLEIFQELRQDSKTFSSLLDDINKQFLTHADQNVLAEASTALLHARSCEDLEEVTEGKVQELWEDTINALRVLKTANPVEGGSEYLIDLCNTVRRIANLASISDCVQIFDTRARKSAKSASNSPLALLIDTIGNTAAEQDADETDETIINAMKAVLFYYMWMARSIQENMAANSPVTNLPNYSSFVETLVAVLAERSSRLDNVRLAAAGTLLDLYTLFATFRHIRPSKPISGDQDIDATIKELVKEISPDAQAHITTTFTAAEKTYAKKSKRSLDVGEDDDPLDVDLDSDPEDSEDEDPDERVAQEKQHEVLLAEKQLCELTGKIVLAIVGRVIDFSGPRKGKLKERLVRNKAKLGSNYKEVVAFLDGPKPKRSHKAKAPQAAKKPVAEMSKPVVVEHDEEEEQEEEEEEEVEEPVEEGGDEDLRTREFEDGEGIEDDSGGEGQEKVVEESEDDIVGD